MNVIARLEYELAYYDSAVHRFNHYTTWTPPFPSVYRLWVHINKQVKRIQSDVRRDGFIPLSRASAQNEKQPWSGFELGSQIQFPTTMPVKLRAPLHVYTFLIIQWIQLYLFSLFNGISTFVGYLGPNLSRQWCYLRHTWRGTKESISFP